MLKLVRALTVEERKQYLELIGRAEARLREEMVKVKSLPSTRNDQVKFRGLAERMIGSGLLEASKT
jgi:hypothetical protein